MTELAGRAAPRSADVHLVDGRHVFLPDGSRLYDVDESTYALLDMLTRSGDAAGVHEEPSRLGVHGTRSGGAIPARPAPAADPPDAGRRPAADRLPGR
jgi:hypothetical protein